LYFSVILSTQFLYTLYKCILFVLKYVSAIYGHRQVNHFTFTFCFYCYVSLTLANAYILGEGHMLLTVLMPVIVRTNEWFGSLIQDTTHTMRKKFYYKRKRIHKQTARTKTSTRLLFQITQVKTSFVCESPAKTTTKYVSYK
jgi:hypothetical protein